MPPTKIIARVAERLRVEVQGKVTEATLEAASRDLIARFGPAGVRRFELWARDPSGRLVPATSLLPPIPRVRKRSYERGYSGAPVRRMTGPPADAPGRTTGFLSGKVVYLSAGHGWVWRDSDYWGTQRGNTNDIVEDFVSAEAVNQYLVRYLVNAGAMVFTVREPDLQENMVIVDNADPGYSESGGDFRAGTLAGYASGQAPYQGDVNPMRLGGSRELTVTGFPAGGIARWLPDVPVDGDYNVYVSYTAAPDRAPDAHYVVRHAGGSTHFRVDQRRHGQTWMPLGTFFFKAGTDPTRAAVELWSDSENPGATLSADAVRLGGGMGNIIRGSGVSGHRRWEEASRYYAQFAGAPASVFNSSTSDGNDDVGTRSRFAAWMHEEGEDAVFVSWHTNAPTPARGTSTYVYGPNPPDGNYTFTGAPGSDRLGRLVHDEVVADIRAAWDSSWRDRGVYTAYFGEVNPRHNDEMPSALIEVAFHDTALDADHLKEPRFRDLVTRAIYQGIAKFFAEKDGVPVRLLPEAPTHLVVRNDGPGRVTVSWWAPPSGGAAGEPATEYRLYRSPDGRAWDNGLAVSDRTTTIEGLAPGELVFVRVTATNAGGESFPTPTLGARSAAAGRAPLLLVHAFDRIDGFSLVPEQAPGLGVVERMFLDRINRFDYVREHGFAAAAAGVSFDSAHSAAVAEGDIGLAGYLALDWMAGEESTIDETISDGEQSRVRAYAAAGGRLLVSGAEIAWDLGYRGAPEDQAFLAEVLGASYALDDGETRRLVGAGSFTGLEALQVDDGTLGAYSIGYPDALAPEAGAQEILRYEGTTNVAGILVPGRVVFLGVPLEALHPASARQALYAKALESLNVRDFAATSADGGVVSDGGVEDGGVADGGASDGGASDGGASGAGGSGGCGCAAGGGSSPLAALLFVFGLCAAAFRRRFRR